MSEPTKTSTQWKHLATTSETDSDGTTHASLHIVEMHSAEEFVVTISGRGAADTGYWIGALMMTTAIFKHVAGDAPLPNTIHVPPTKQH